MSASNTTLYQSANSSTSTLRPRNARLISYIEEGNDSNAGITTTAPSGSSKPSPVFPGSGPGTNHAVGRTKSLNQGRQLETGGGHARKASDGGPSAAAPDLWSSWSSIASSLLGTDATPSKGRSTSAHQQPKWMKQDRTYATSPTSPQWGPSTNKMSPATQHPLEDRQALLQAKKREALLMATATENRDINGKYKRRDSNAYTREEDANEEALVYIHKIKREDTLAGVTLKYGCQPDAFRKVNRFWPNDNIQTRKQVFLPVEACTVRGKKVDQPDLLGTALEDLKVQDASDNRSFSSSKTGDMTSSPTYSDMSRSASNTEAQDLRHDSWVSIPSFSNPVEILRMPRKSLGYFPRARRKSNATLTDTSTASTPRTSFDTLRHPPTHAAQTSASLNASPVRRPVLRQDSDRQRSSSTTATQKSFVDALRGPGGVGTLRGLRTEPSRPGPAEDPLNKKFAQYFPDINVAPPEEIPRISLSSARGTPRASTDSVRSVRSNSSGLGDVPGAIEGFVRKMAGAKSKTGGASRMDDLIELETNSDLGDPILDDDDDQATPTATTMNVSGSRGFERPSDEDLLNARFPIRGRVMNAYGQGVGKDKGD